jgi:hypothetical protein
MLRDTTGTYGNYLFSVDGCTVLDTGLVVNDETRSAEPKVMLTDNVFHYSTYTLKLEVLHFTGVNVLDGDVGDYRVVDTLEIELLKDTWVPIPLDDLEDNYIISLDAVVEIKHDKPEIHMIEGLTVNGEPDIIQTGETAEVYAQLIDYGGYLYNINDASGKTVYFFEQLTPSLTVSATPNPIQSGDTTDIYSTVKDSDGSVAKNTKVYFYQKFGEIPPALSVTADKSILSYADSEKAVLTAKLTGETVEGKTVTFKQGDTVLATETTDSNGEAEYEYTSQGVGDVTITVECMNLQETYTIEDCINYDSLTSNSGKWTIPSGVTSQYSDNGWKVSANAYKQIKLTDKLTSDCSVEFTVVDYYSSSMSSYPPVIIYAYTNGETTPNQLLLMNTGASAFTALTDTINHAVVKGGVYRIEYTSSTLKVYENGTLLATANSSVGLPTRFEFHMGANSRNATYKDLKIKPL